MPTQEKYYETGSADYLPLAGQALHFRNIQTAACLTPTGNVQIRAELHDYLAADEYQKVHIKVFRIEVDPKTGIVVAADFGMPQGGPHSVCANLPVGPEKLVGVHAGAQLGRAARKFYRRTNGCTHILSLIEATIPVIHQATAFLVNIPDIKYKQNGDTTGKVGEDFVNKLKGACHALSEERYPDINVKETVKNYTDFIRYNQQKENEHVAQ